MQIITLTTDLGTKDHFVASMKGDIVSKCPTANIIDISHNIESFNISAAAFVLKNAFPHYPENTCHLVVVNAHHKRGSNILITHHVNQYFVCPDNGLLPLMFDDFPDEVYEVDPSSQNGKVRDSVRAEISLLGAKLVNGKKPAELGMPVKKITEYRFPQPDQRLNVLQGSVLHIDSFQNIYVNITREKFGEICQDRPFKVMFHRGSRDSLSQISSAYYDCPEGDPVCTFNSNGYLVIALNKGKAGSLLGIDIDSPVLIEFD